MHGSGRVTLRNRKFLRKILPLASDCRTTSAYLPVPTPASVPTTEQAVSPVVPSTPAEPPSDMTNVDTPVISVPSAEGAPPAHCPLNPPAVNDLDDPAISVDETTVDVHDHQAPAIPPLRPTRNRRAPAWHADYKMQ